MISRIIIYNLLFFCLLLTAGINAELHAQDIKIHPPPYVIRKVPDSVVEDMKNQREFSYANDPSSWTKKKPEEDGAFLKLLNAIASSPWLKWILYFLLGVLIVYILYQVMVVNNFFVFSRSAKKKQSDSIEEEEVIPWNLEEQLSKALEEKAYRPATRLMYLQILQTLQNKNRIMLHARATNQDYIRQMHHTPGSREFRELTGIYEYVWYGEFQPDQKQFEIIEDHFKKFVDII